MAPLLSASRRSRRTGDFESTPAPAAASSRNRPSTPEYEPLTTPLNDKAQRALESLYSAPHFRQLKEHIRQASDKVTETAGEANERMSDARHRFEKMRGEKRAASTAARRKRKKNRNNDNEDDNSDRDDEDEDEDEEDEEEEDDEERQAEMRKLDTLEAKVKQTTSQLEEKMRTIIDAEYKVSGLQVAIQEIAADAKTAGAALDTSRRRARLRERGVNVDSDGDEEMEDNEDQEDEEDAAPTVVPTQIIKERFAGHESQWEQQSLTQRYTTNNTYINFYRVVHEAKYPTGEVPPVPAASTWFNHLEPNRRRAAAANRGQNSATAAVSNNEEATDDSDADVEIERERLSLKCPLTLRVFEDPVKNSKCIHSFERNAIEDMIRSSSMTVPAGENDFQAGGGRNARARRVRALPCPICSVPISLNDLESDLVLVRRVRRMREVERREQEEAELGGRRRVSNGVTIDSNDEESDDDDEEEKAQETRRQREEEIRIKREKSRMSSRAPTVAREDVYEAEDELLGDVGHNDEDDDEDVEVTDEDEEDEDDD